MASDLYKRNTLVFADDQVLMAGSAENLQKGILS